MSESREKLVVLGSNNQPITSSGNLYLDMCVHISYPCGFLWTFLTLLGWQWAISGQLWTIPTHICHTSDKTSHTGWAMTCHPSIYSIQLFSYVCSSLFRYCCYHYHKQLISIRLTFCCDARIEIEQEASILMSYICP